MDDYRDPGVGDTIAWIVMGCVFGIIWMVGTLLFLANI